jgi:carbonic anhydrase
MKTSRVSLFLAACIMPATSFSSGAVHWGYTGHSGPEHWGQLSPEFAVCASGRNQSPINLTGMIDGNLPKLAIAYKTGGDEVVNNGHTIKINYQPGSMITLADRSFELKQLHFHSPSENTIEGRYFPLEAHFVHADTDGNLAVVTVMYEHGEVNTELTKAWQKMPAETGKTARLDDQVDAKKLLPGGRDYYRFNGSLTTPPCSEGVTWIVMKKIETVSKEQVEKFSQVMGHDNNRPLQPLNARVVVK